MNTPLAELGFIGMATGMALLGLRPVVEVQFADFISSGFDSIVQFAATTHYRWGGAVPWVIRGPQRRWSRCRSVSQSESRSLVRPCSGTQGRGARHSCRCERAAGCCDT